MKIKHIGPAGWRQGVVATALMPLLAFCSSGPGAVPATAAANEQIITGPATIYINEVLAHTDPPQVDSVELYNPNSSAVDLTGWCISDDPDSPDRFCIGAGSIIPAEGYIVYEQANGGLPFGFSEFGEEVHLYAPGAAGLQPIDGIKFGVSPNGVSLGRYVTSTGGVDFPLQSNVTLGAANAGPQIPPVVISELMYQPAQGPEYLVLSNSSSRPVPLYDPANPANTWHVAGIGRNNGEYALPAQMTLQPGESVVLTADPTAFTTVYAARTMRVFGPYAGKLDNEGERIVLQAPQPPETDGKVAYADMDVVNYGVAAPWPAAGAEGNALVRIDLLGYGNNASNWRSRPPLGTTVALMLPLVRR